MKMSVVEKRKAITDLFSHVVVNFFEKMNKGGVRVSSEDELKMEIVYYLRSFKNLYAYTTSSRIEVGVERKVRLKSKTVKTPSKDASIDIVIEYFDYNLSVKCAIELKYIAVEQAAHKGHKKIFVESSGNTDNSKNRLNIYADLENLEQYTKSGYDFGFLLFITNFDDFYNKEPKGVASNFSLVHGVNLSQRSYKYSSKSKNNPVVKLKKNYVLNWVKTRNFSYLLIEVNKI